jgi:hypothetical protein
LVWFLNFAKLGCEPSRHLDVSALRLLVSTCEQDDERAAATREVQPVARPRVHAQLGHRAIDRLSVAEVSFLDRDDPRQDSRTGAAITQPVDPSAEVLGLEDFDHKPIVSVWIHRVKTPRTGGSDGAL